MWIPPGVLKPLPEQPCLPDAPDFVPARDNAFCAVLDNHLAQRADDARLQLFQVLIVRPEFRVAAATILLSLRGALLRRNFSRRKGRLALGAWIEINTRRCHGSSSLSVRAFSSRFDFAHRNPEPAEGSPWAVRQKAGGPASRHARLWLSPS